MTVSATRLQAYQSLGPEARRLHRAYLAKRRELREARQRMNDLWFACARGFATDEQRAELEQARERVSRLYEEMLEAQRKAAHCERAV